MMRSKMRTITGLAVLSAVLLLPGGSVVSASPEATATTSAARIARRVTIPAGTVLRLRVDRGFGSDISRVEDPVSATLTRAVVIDGRTILPAGSTAAGYVSEAVRPGKVKGRGRVAVRFTRIDPGPGVEPYRMQTRSWVAVAPATKKKDALTIGIPAAGGAVVGALVDGKKGAAIGSAVGGGAGTAVVLTTRGKDVRVGRGAVLSVRLMSPLMVSVSD
jgi:hypothetical protein